MKIKRKVSPVFPSFTPLSSFYCRHVSIFGPFSWLRSGMKVCRDPGNLRVTGEGLFSTVFINPDIRIY